MRTLLLLCFAFSLNAQQVFDETYRFAPGVYFSHAALVENKPDLDWEAVDGEMVQVTDDNRIQIEGYGAKDGNTTRPYAISLKGQPYFFVAHNLERDYLEFVGLRVRGPYSGIVYDSSYVTRRLMRAFNPATGLPFREAMVERKKSVTIGRVIDLRSGRRFPLDPHTLMQLLARDQELVSALSVPANQDGEKMLRALKIYGQRYPLSLPLTPLN